MNGLKDAHKQAAMLVTFFITVRLCENGVYAVHVTTILGDKINLNCLTNQSPKEITLVKWSRSITAASQDIASYNADYGLFKFFKDDRLTVSSYNGTCLQIQPVYLTDEGNYTCEITAFTGIFRDHFSLSVLVPPTISLSVNSLPNGLKNVHCIASKGKPAATITWKENTFGNLTHILVDNVDGTVTVESQYHTAINLTEQEQTCIVNHPAFNATQNLTISLGDNTKMMSPQIKFILITCASAMAVVGTVLLVIWIMKKKMKKIAKPERRKQVQVFEDRIYQNVHDMKMSQYSIQIR
ncbi:cell surface glycoprotein CD200 receptor 1-like isoform X2 [Heterodontus francisci]|uniref:cell surface glycoprotein CD200 receptor 1-like isoform X2 n=1 Tax=Heterodontus francisci TaxID=7792 RepID=UPI00355AFA03